MPRFFALATPRFHGVAKNTLVALLGKLDLVALSIACGRADYCRVK